MPCSQVHFFRITINFSSSCSVFKVIDENLTSTFLEHPVYIYIDLCFSQRKISSTEFLIKCNENSSKNETKMTYLAFRKRVKLLLIEYVEPNSVAT